MRSATRYRAAVLWTGIAAFAAASPAVAQMPPSEAADIASCLCLRQAVDTLGGEWNARQQAYDTVRDDLARLDDQLQRARAGMDVNNPQNVAQFRQLLEQRDAAFRRSTEMATGDLAGAIERYNVRVNEYNARCANRPRYPGMLAQVQATLRCPPPY